MAQTGQITGQVDSMHGGGVTDCGLDYYGKRLATASADNTIHIFDLIDGQQRAAGELKSHEGPVWKVSWAHPRFGQLLASCSYDMRIIIWKEAQPSQWQIAYVNQEHTASVNTVEFGPCEYGLRLACASSDGQISVLTYGVHDAQWRRVAFPAHGNGASSVSWAPVAAGSTTMRLVSGGNDARVIIWKCENENWTQDSLLWHSDCHTDWVRDVAWRPTGNGMIASGSWDKSVCIWSQEMENQPWRLLCKLQIPGKVESLAWSVTGSTLAVTTQENETYLYREASNGGFEQVATVSEVGIVDTNPAPVPPKALESFGAPPPAAIPPPAAAPPQNAEFQQQQQNVMDSFGL